MTPAPQLHPEFLERFAAAAVDGSLTDAVYSVQPTPLGVLTVVVSPRGVCRIAFPEESADRVLAEVANVLGPAIVASKDATGTTRDALAAYLEGDSTRLDLPVDLALVRAPFQLDVLTELQRVPRGEVETYGGLAARIGRPRAFRATGTALGRNPIPILVPCHRVVPGSGGVGNYGGGADRKRALLQLEGALPS